MTNLLDFTFSDLISGYVTSYDPIARKIELKTSDGRDYSLELNDNSYAKLTQNLGESWQDRTGLLTERLKPGQMIFAYGTFFPEDEIKFEVNCITSLVTNLNRICIERRGGGSSRSMRLPIAI